MNIKQKEAVAFRIRQARTACGLTQQQAAELSKISKDALRGYENGRCLPGLEALVQLSRLYRVSTDSLLGVHLQGMEAEKRGVDRGPRVSLDSLLAGVRQLHAERERARAVVERIRRVLS